MALPTTAEEFDRRLGVIVTEALAEAKIPQRKAEELTGIPHTTFRRYLKGHSSLPASRLARIADLLGVTVTSLIAQAEDVAA